MKRAVCQEPNLTGRHSDALVYLHAGLCQNLVTRHISMRSWENVRVATEQVVSNYQGSFRVGDSHYWLSPMACGPLGRRPSFPRLGITSPTVSSNPIRTMGNTNNNRARPWVGLLGSSGSQHRVVRQPAMVAVSVSAD